MFSLPRFLGRKPSAPAPSDTFKIFDRFHSNILFECARTPEYFGYDDSVLPGYVVQTAVKQEVSLAHADLRKLDGALEIYGGYFFNADFTGADIGRSIFSRSNLEYATFKLTDASVVLFSDCNLSNSDFTGARLQYPDFTNSNLDGAVFSSFKQDMIAEILRLPYELDALRSAIISGRIDGSTYSGECSCLAGTLATARDIVEYDGEDIVVGDLVFAADMDSPRELWFSMIHQGDTPETNQASRLALAWLDDAILIRNNILRGKQQHTFLV